MTTPSIQLPGVNITSERITQSLTQQIRAELNSTGILPTSRFYVDIPAPRVFRQPGFDVKTVLLMCQNRGSRATLPGIQLNTSSVRRYGTGLEERKPISAIVVDQQFSFICDRDGIIHDYFNLWMNSIVAANKFKATDNDTTGGTDPSRYPGSVLYKTEYTVDIDIFLTDAGASDGTFEPVLHHVTLYNAFPIALGDIQLGWEDSNDFVQVPVTFTYTHWRSQFIDLNVTDPGLPPSSSLKDLLLKAGSAALLISTLKKPRNIQDALSIVNNAKTIIGGFNFSFGK